MSEEELQLLITLDDPEGAPEEDTFHHQPDQPALDEKSRASLISSNDLV